MLGEGGHVELVGGGDLVLLFNIYKKIGKW